MTDCITFKLKGMRSRFREECGVPDSIFNYLKHKNTAVFCLLFFFLKKEYEVGIPSLLGLCSNISMQICNSTLWPD